MLRISRLADYGIVLLGYLALEPDESWTARRLADRSGLPLPTVSKLLKKLSRGGLLTSERGSTGGYRTSRSARDTTVAEVITVIDGPISFTECALGRCDTESCCPMRASWKRINDVVRGALAGLTIADLLARTAATPGRGAQVVQLRAR